MTVALKYILKKEWSMGNGQCPECCGVPESWHGHPHYLASDTIGHEKDCDLAISIKELGGEPLLKGDYKSDIVYGIYDRAIIDAKGEKHYFLDTKEKI